MLYQQIIWDWNGTLLNDVAACVAASNYTIQALGGRPIDAEIYLTKIGHPPRFFFEEYGVDFTKYSMNHVSELFHNCYLEERKKCDLHPETVAVLKDVKQLGLTRQVILSAHPQGLLDEVIAHFQLAHYFSEIVGHHDSSADSKVGNGLKLLDKKPELKSSTVIIGDTEHDAEVADALGIQCILWPYGLNAKERLEKHAHFPIAENESDLRRLLGL